MMNHYYGTIVATPKYLNIEMLPIINLPVSVRTPIGLNILHPLIEKCLKSALFP